MELYINGYAAISPIKETLTGLFGDDAVLPNVQVKNSVEPDYKEFVPAASMRRMTRIIKMGIWSALKSLKDAGVEQPDAIITATGIGCFEDTDKFLRSMDENSERLLNPTPFIQSTHNTVSGQIALLLKNHHYNFTYTHQGVSFEYALTDAMLCLNEDGCNSVLVGGFDENIPALTEIFTRVGYVRKVEELDADIRKSGTGYCLGEGSAFFVLSKNRNATTKACIKGLKIMQHVSNAKELNNTITDFLKEIGIGKIDLILSGLSGDKNSDAILSEYESLNKNQPFGYFKQLCGEYFTSGSFALWLASWMISNNTIPTAVTYAKNISSELNTVLIINQFRSNEYSLICVSK